MSASEFAPAKVNLHLHVVGRRADGYHLLDSLVVFANVGDCVSVERADDLTLSVTGPFAAGLGDEGDNLVLRAARSLASQAGVKPCGRIVLAKNLPVASGLGGGSADAAATLRLLSRVWAVDVGAEALDTIASSLGADVPVCLLCQPSVMFDIGVQVAPAPLLPALGLVLINPGLAVSTPAVFRARVGPFSVAVPLPTDGWANVDELIGTLAAAGNDLEPPALALEPSIAPVLAALAGTPECRLARMSGSGATCFGVFATPEAARDAANSLSRPGWWVWGGALFTK